MAPCAFASTNPTAEASLGAEGNLGTGADDQS